jgi:L-fucose mutarotase
MLKGISPLISPALLKALCEMGHGDELVIADGNFPSASMGKDAIVIRMDGHGVPEILDAILTVFPLDTYVEKPATLMQLMDRDVGRVETPIWDEYAAVIAKHDARGKEALGNIDRFDFYDEAKKCYCIIATGESAIYANIMLQKGVI